MRIREKKNWMVQREGRGQRREYEEVIRLLHICVSINSRTGVCLVCLSRWPVELEWRSPLLQQGGALLAALRKQALD